MNCKDESGVLTCGLSRILKLLPISSVAKSITEPLTRDIETASMRMLEGFTDGCENKL